MAQILAAAPVLTAEQDRWAEALLLARLHGDAAPLWIATRVGELALAGDMDGVERYRAIATRYERLLTSTVQ